MQISKFIGCFLRLRILSKYKWVPTILFLVFFIPYSAQVFQKKANYLVDSIDLSLLSKQELITLDSVISIYKNSASDTIKFNAISYFIEQCGDAEVWVRYNDFLLQSIESKIKIGKNSKKVIFAFKKILAAVYNNKGYYYGEKGNNDLQIYFYNKGLSMRMQVGDKEGEAASLNNLGYAHKIKGDTKKAISYYQQSAHVFSLLNDTPGQALSNTNMGVIYENLGDIKNAIEYFDRSLRLYESMKDKKGVSHAFYNLGSLYLGQKDIKKAREYFWKSLILRKEVNYGVGVGFCFSNIGQTYQLEEKHDSSIYYFNQGLTYFKGQYKLGEANCLANIGNALIRTEKPKEAISYLDSAEKLQTEISFKQGLTATKVNLARAYFMQGDLNLAQNKAETALAMAKELGYPNSIRDASKLLYEVAKKKGDFKTALLMNELYITMRDSILNLENEKLTYKQQTKYEFEKVQVLKDAQHDKEVALLEAKKNEQKIITWVVCFFLIVVLLLTWVIYNRLNLVRSQNKIIEAQKQDVESAHQSLFEKNKEILDSINYAKRIQEAFLRKDLVSRNSIPDHFVFFKPKDIVSGDFFWKYEKDNFLYIAAADCTGHGVPGALLTMIGTSFLNEILSSNRIYTPAEILNQLRSRIIDELNQSGSASETKDGMDISLLRIELGGRDRRNAIWAGANNGLYLISDSTKKIEQEYIQKEIANENRALFSVRPDKMPIGYYEKIADFTDVEFTLEKGDFVFLYTDGFADQFGGAKGKKYKYSALKQTLLTISKYSIEIQSQKLDKEFNDWKADLEQVDDVTIIGISI